MEAHRLCDRLKHTDWQPACSAVAGIVNGVENS
jgi:hypothetical protein